MAKKEKVVEPIFVPDTGRIQPQATDLERAVLGALMLEKDAFTNIGEMLRPECFYDKRHALIFTAISDLARRNDGMIDLLTVIEQLKQNGDLKAAGDVLYVSGLTNDLASSVHIESHAKIILQKHLARELIRFTGKIQGQAYDETVGIDDLMQEAEKDLFNIAQTNIKRDAIQINPIINDAMTSIKQAASNRGGLSGISSGFTGIDKITSGWQKSDLIIIAARPAMGKTAFVLSMAKNMAVDAKKPVAIFSLEMSNIQLINRLIANVCEIQGDKIKSGVLQKHEWEQLDTKIRELYDAPIYVDDTPSLSIFELRTKARSLVRTANIECLIIDYLQLMNSGEKNNSSREQEVSKISRSLKGLAKELNIPIIALSQLNRSVETRAGLEGKRPQLSDLRESGAIEQDADLVCFIHRPEVYGIKTDSEGNDLTNRAEIIVAKHRNGAIGEVWLWFKRSFTRFENIEGAGAFKEFDSSMNSQEPMPIIGANETFLNESEEVPF